MKISDSYKYVKFDFGAFLVLFQAAFFPHIIDDLFLIDII